MPKVKTVMATVPANVPRPKISAQMLAMTSVGSVRTMLSRKRSTASRGPLRLMLAEAATA